MATKTISIDLDAYQRLNRARLHPKDSFSQVIKRAQWQQTAKSCHDLLTALPSMPVADDDVLERLEAAQKSDLLPDNPWL